MRLHNEIGHRRRHHAIVKREPTVEPLQRRQILGCWWGCPPQPPQQPGHGNGVCHAFWCPPWAQTTTSKTTARPQTTSTRAQTTQRATTSVQTQAPTTRQNTPTPTQQQQTTTSQTAPAVTSTTSSSAEQPTTTTQTDRGSAAGPEAGVTSPNENVQVKPQTTSYFSTFTDALGVPYGLDDTGGIHALPTNTGTPGGAVNPPPNVAGATSSGNSIGGIVGGIIGAIAFLVILIFCMIHIRKRQRSRRVAPSSEFVGRSPASSAEWRTRTSPFQRMESPVDPPMPAYGSAYYGDSYTGAQSPQPRFRDDRANSPQSYPHY